MEYRSFAFLDYRWELFGAVRNDFNQNGDLLCHPYLQIVDPTRPFDITILGLDEIVIKRHSHSTIDINVGSGAGHEEDSLAGNRSMPFVSDTVRGITIADVYLYHRDVQEGGDSLESFVFVVHIEELLAKASSLSNLGSRYVGWRDFCLSTAMFSYHPAGEDRYRILSRDSYVSGFRYVSPIQPLVLEDPNGPRCFFVYDSNPCRETSGFLPAAAGEGPHPEIDYSQSASEIMREVIGD